MFRLQLIMLTWDKSEVDQVIQEAVEVLQQLQQPGAAAPPGDVAVLKLNFTILQVSLDCGHKSFPSTGLGTLCDNACSGIAIVPVNSDRRGPRLLTNSIICPSGWCGLCALMSFYKRPTR